VSQIDRLALVTNGFRCTGFRIVVRLLDFVFPHRGETRAFTLLKKSNGLFSDGFANHFTAKHRRSNDAKINSDDLVLFRADLTRTKLEDWRSLIFEGVSPFRTFFSCTKKGDQCTVIGDFVRVCVVSYLDAKYWDDKKSKEARPCYTTPSPRQM
jgi:hypothetical protein